MKSGLISIVTLLLFLSACTTAVQYSAKDEAFLRQRGGMQPWRTVVVLPFSGDPAIRCTSAEWFTHQIKKHRLFEIIEPAMAEIELGKKGLQFGTADIPVGSAREAGRILGADGVIVGTTKISNTLRPGDSFWQQKGSRGLQVAGVSIVDVQTGTVVATSARSDDDAAAAVEFVVKDILPSLYAAAKRNWSPPGRTGISGQDREAGP